MPALVAYAHSRNAHRCPSCGRSIVRIRRRRLDRMRGLFMPVWRFACSDADCPWTGTLRRDDLRVPLTA